VEGDKLSYGWSATGGAISGNSSTAIWTAPDEPGKYTISVSVTAEKSNKATESVIITVRENHPPEIIDLKASEERIVPLGDCIITCEASDSDDDELNYNWEASGGGITGKGSIVTWSAPEGVGAYAITVVVVDGKGAKSSASLPVSVMMNHPPVIDELKVTPAMKVRHGTICTITCLAQDADGDELSYAWSASRGGLFPEGNGVATWIPPKSDGAYDVTVVVRDSRGGEDNQSVQIKVGCG
jgi:REJ domain.